MCLETGVYWRYNLSEGEMKRTIRNRKGEDSNRLSINVLELVGMVVAAYVMIVIRKDRPMEEEESVRMRRDSSSGVQWVITAGGEWRGDIGRDDENHGDVGADRGVKFPSKTIVGRGKRLDDGITRGKEDDTQTRLTVECPNVLLHAQELGV